MKDHELTIYFPDGKKKTWMLDGDDIEINEGVLFANDERTDLVLVFSGMPYSIVAPAKKESDE